MKTKTILVIIAVLVGIAVLFIVADATKPTCESLRKEIGEKIGTIGAVESYIKYEKMGCYHDKV